MRAQQRHKQGTVEVSRKAQGADRCLASGGPELWQVDFLSHSKNTGFSEPH